MKTEEMDDRKIIGLNVKLTYKTPSTITKPKEDELMIVSSSDESIESNNFSTFSGASANPSESYSVTGTKGSPNAVYSDLESECSVKDNENCHKIIYNDFWNTDLVITSDNEPKEIKRGNNELKYTENYITGRNYNISLEEKEKQTMEQKHHLNIFKSESPIKLSFQENKYVPNNKRNAVKCLEDDQDLNQKKLKVWENKSTENNKKKLFLSEQFNSDKFQTYPSQLFSTLHLEDTSQDPHISSSKYFVSSESEAIKNKWDKLLEKNQKKIPNNNDYTVTSINKDSIFPTKPVQSRTGHVLDSLKNKIETLSPIYNKFKNEMSQWNFSDNISESNNNSRSHSFPFKNLKTDNTQLKNKNTDSGAANKCSSEGKLYDKLNSVNKEISQNFSGEGNQFPRLGKFLASKDDSFHSQKSKIFNLNFITKEKTGLRNSNQGSSMNTCIPNQEIKYSSFLNNASGYNSQTSFSYTETNYKDANLTFCDNCKKTFSRVEHGKITNNEIQKDLSDSGIPNIDKFLQIFNTDNILAKNILLAVSSKELANKATYTNVVKYLRKKNLFSIKLVKEVKAFLQASVNAQVLKLKGKRYILSQRIGTAEIKRTQDRKKKEVEKTLKGGKKTLSKLVNDKERKLQTNVEKNTLKKFSHTSKKETRKSKMFGNPSKNTGNQVVKKKSKAKVKARSVVPKLSEGKKIDRKKKQIEAKLLKKILNRKDSKREFKK